MSTARAVCVRCGAERVSFRDVCPGCGLHPQNEGLLVAWLLSTEHLRTEELDEVGERIRTGEIVEPTRRMLRRARKALGQTFATDPGLPWWQASLLAVAVAAASPLVAWVCFGFWRQTRPRAALQALALAVPFTVVFVALGWVLSHWG